MAKNLFSLTDIRNKPHRDGFDLSFRNVFSASLGQLLPVVNKMCFPGDSFKINVNWFTRTQPCSSPAFTRFTEYYDFFFVPIHFLWRHAPQFFSQTNADNFAAGVPTSLDSNDVYFESCPSITSSQITTLFEHVGSADHGTGDLGLYTEGYAKCFDELGYCRAFGMKRLLEMLNYEFGIQVTPSKNVREAPVTNVTRTDTFQVNVLPLLAYQKIYNDFYRNSQWERPTPTSFNADYYYDFNSMEGIEDVLTRSYGSTNYGFGRSMFDLAYADFSKDYFTGVLPSKQFGEASLASPIVGDGDNILFLGGSQANAASPTGSVRGLSMSAPSGANVIQVDKFPLGISALAIRQAEFLQKWKEITASGGTDYVTQMQKHFGVTPSKDIAHKVQFLGGVSKRFGVDEVVNTNLQGQNGQANIMGKGLNVGDGHINFKCNEHGILMCIYHIGIQPEYDGIFDKELTKTTPQDFMIPEFDNIGMQPVSVSELGKGISNPRFSDIRGYVPRYSEYKTSVDQIHGVFQSTLPNWVTPVNDMINHAQVAGQRNGSSYVQFKQSPALLDNIFGVRYDGTYDTDQFLVNADFDIKAVRNISRNGLPY